MKPLQYRILPIILGMVLLLWQFCLVYHQTEHSLGEPDEICLLCQAADHMQHGLAATSLPVILPAAVAPAEAASTFLFPQSYRAPSARSPPASLLS